MHTIFLLNQLLFVSQNHACLNEKKNFANKIHIQRERIFYWKNVRESVYLFEKEKFTSFQNIYNALNILFVHEVL